MRPTSRVAQENNKKTERKKKEKYRQNIKTIRHLLLLLMF
jgi:hypothetical protein